jgi:crotonobetainyl-CoA:carnitine CoA-transferase CaiB-like acyl-CoA transferase
VAGPPLPLEGIRVLDLGGSIGAYAARLLGDLGADVVKVETPAGDPMRRKPPFLDGAEGPEASLLFAAYHANKRGVTLDVTSDDALPLLAELGAGVDVVVLTTGPRARIAGLDGAGRPSWVGAGTVVTAVTPFGLTGPYAGLRATPLVSYAMGGLMHRNGPPEGPPYAVPGQQQWDEAGIHAALATVAALEARADVGGQLVDIAVHEVAAAKDFLLERYDKEGMGAWGRMAGTGLPPTGTWQTANGPLDVSCHQPRHWGSFLEMLDHPDELSEPALEDPLIRRELFEGLQEVIGGIMAARDRAELFERGQRAGLPCNPAHTVAEFVADAQPRARELFHEVPLDDHGTVEIPWGGAHARPPVIALRRPAPTLGQHNREVYVDGLGHTEGDLGGWREKGLV